MSLTNLRSCSSRSPTSRRKIEAELRVLEVELPHLIVVDHQDLSRFRAIDRRQFGVSRTSAAPFVRRSGQPAARFLAPIRRTFLFPPETSGRQGRLCEIEVALAEASPVHEWLQPVHGQITARRRTDLLDQLQHLIKAERVERKQEGIEEDRREGARENPRAQKKGARDARNARRDNGLHRRRCDVEHSANSRADVRGCDEAHEKWRTKVGFEPHESLHSSWPLTRVSTRCGFLVELHSPLQSQIRSEEGLSPAGGRHEAALARLPATGLHWSTAWTI